MNTAERWQILERLLQHCEGHLATGDLFFFGQNWRKRRQIYYELVYLPWSGTIVALQLENGFPLGKAVLAKQILVF